MPRSENPQMRFSTSPSPNLLQYCQKALHNFLTPQPPPRFQIVHTASTRDKPGPFRPQSDKAQTIAILDSSFNPPTLAHLSLATSILRPPPNNNSSTTTTTTTTATKTQQPKEYGATRFYTHPTRLLLLFSTHNADKDPAPAAFEHRLALMILFARDIVELYTSGRRRQQPPNERAADTRSLSRSDEGMLENTAAHKFHISEIDRDADDARRNANTDTNIDIDIDIDVALTSEPFYSDKSAAICASGIYDSPHNSTPSPSPSPSSESSPTPESIPESTAAPNNDRQKATHIHLLGHDTFLRILTPHYYSQQGHDPPLSALGDFFSHHGLRVTLRASAAGAPSDPFTDSERHVDAQGGKSMKGLPREEKEKEDQLSTWRSLAHGSLEHLGGRWEWSRRIEVVDPETGKGVDWISSTVVRRAVERGQWDVVAGCCTPGVIRGIKDWGLYRFDDGGGGRGGSDGR